MITAADIIECKEFLDIVEDLVTDLYNEHRLIDLHAEQATRLLQDNAYKHWAVRELISALEGKAGARAREID